MGDPFSLTRVSVIRSSMRRCRAVGMLAAWGVGLAGSDRPPLAEPVPAAGIHWAWQPLRRPVVPASGNPIDAFVEVARRGRGLSANPPAAPRDLLRRVHFDLVGLPPSPGEVMEFERDPSPERYRQVVTRLLESPQYGERWARHWLDVVRYTESQGFEYDHPRDHAWHYRDYVIRSFNADKPYDRFMREQVAGDVMEPVTGDGIIGAGLLVAGPWDQAGNSQANATQRAITREEEMEDLVSVVGQTFLGVTIHCARCHDHKFDPVPIEDYYRVKAVFDGVRHGDRPIEGSAERKVREAEKSLLVGEISAARERVQRIEEQGAARAADADPGVRVDEAPKPWAARTFADGKVQGLPGEIQGGAEILARLEPGERTERDELLARIGRAQAALALVERPLPLAYAGKREQPKPTPVLKRGDVRSPGLIVAPAGLSALTNLTAELGLDPESPEGERRLRFADWLADPRNPLPARVMVNRVWQYHFGQGLVTTPSDFGVSGARPTHPELLDWLASEFIANGWRLKPLHQLILGSDTYRQASRARAEALSVDADNQWLWRHPPRRLEAEAVRDAMLSVSGRLNPEMGGPSFRSFTTSSYGATFYHLFFRDEPAFNRRTIYRMNINSGKDPFLDAFDCPDPSVKTPRRGVTTTPLQALGLMNGEFVQTQASALAARASALAGNDPVGSMEQAWRLALGRGPDDAERDQALAAVRERGLPALCWVLLNSTEFLHVQ